MGLNSACTFEGRGSRISDPSYTSWLILKRPPPESILQVADWFAQLNNKMGGDLKKIQVVGKYMVEVWKAVGMDLSKVEFLSSSEEINKRPDEYWTLVMDIARKNNLKRIVRYGGLLWLQLCVRRSVTEAYVNHPLLRSVINDRLPLFDCLPSVTTSPL